MIGKEIYKIWAPENSIWMPWVRPVPFVQMIESSKQKEYFNTTIPSIRYVNKAENNIAIIVDLPSYEGVCEGIGLAKLGFRPIPVYNGTNGQEGALSNIDNNSLEHSLMWGAFELKKLSLDEAANPVFLMDSDRMNSFKMNAKVYDNSWDIYSQDLPSSFFFLNHGIDSIIVRSDYIRRDLQKILYTYQKDGISVFQTNGYDEPKKVVIRKVKDKE